jgi:predicted transposase/invertase (TIGR01784 family)
VKTDTLFYQLFQTFPQFFFDLIHLPPETANFYQFASVEVKQLSFRIDGVFLPQDEEQPIYFLEVQFQRDLSFYSRFFSEIFLYLHQSDLRNDWRGVILYPNRQIETPDIRRYQELLTAQRVSRLYLSEIDAESASSVGLATLQLLIAQENQAVEQGRTLIERVRREVSDERQQQALLQLIESILVYKLPLLDRKEIEAMFSISDLKHTKVYQEALEEGRLEGEREGKREGKLEAKLETIPRLLALGLSPQQIAEVLDLPLETVEASINPFTSE